MMNETQSGSSREVSLDAQCNSSLTFKLSGTDSPGSLTANLNTHLILRRSSNGKLKPHPFPGQLSVHFGVRIEPVIHPSPLLLIQDDLQHFTPILARPRTLADDFHGVHDILEESVVHGGQGAGMGTFLGLRGARTGRTFGPREDAAGGEDEDVALGEFLFEFAG